MVVGRGEREKEQARWTANLAVILPTKSMAVGEKKSVVRCLVNSVHFSVLHAWFRTLQGEVFMPS